MRKYVACLVAVILMLISSRTSGLVTPAHALEMPAALSTSVLVYDAGFTANAYAVLDAQTGEMLAAKNETQAWPPASITKLVTAMVVLDTKPSMNKIVTMKQVDQVGGSQLLTKVGVSYRLKDLFYALLLPSANNAAYALARSTGLSQEQFVTRMNAKAASLGATSTHFVEPSGLDPANVTTAADYVKIARAAFKTAFIQQVAGTKEYTIKPTNKRKYTVTVKNTDKLLGDSELTMLGGKTGYIDESQYNFVSLIRNNDGKEIVVAVFGSKNPTTEFAETKELAMQVFYHNAFGVV